jgi:archaemetzincin
MKLFIIRYSLFIPYQMIYLKKLARHTIKPLLIASILGLFLMTCRHPKEEKRTKTNRDTNKVSALKRTAVEKKTIQWQEDIFGKNNAGKFNYNLYQLNGVVEKLKPLHRVMAKPKPGEWLASHRERGQTFQQYLTDKPIKLDAQRRKIYLMPLGFFDKTDKELLDAVAEYLALYFELEVVLQAPQTPANFPEEAYRTQNYDYPGNLQYFTPHILHKILLPNLPSDALAFMAISNQDLYPDESWNFVFGQASTKKRVGVASYFRYLQEEKPSFSQTLRRIIATSSHEIGHMLTLYHCRAFECVMNGSNSLSESDSRPIYPCAECIVKLSWNIGFSIPQHYQKLLAFYQKHGLTAEADYCRKVLDVGL